MLHVSQNAIWKQYKPLCDMVEMIDGRFVESMEFIELHNTHKEGISLCSGDFPLVEFCPAVNIVLSLLYQMFNTLLTPYTFRTFGGLHGDQV